MSAQLAVVVLLLGVAGAIVTGDPAYTVDVLLGIESAFDPGPWPLLLPLSVIGYLAIPAVVGLLVAVMVERAAAAERFTLEELQEEIRRELRARPQADADGDEGDDDSAS